MRRRVISVAMYFQYAHHFPSRVPLKKWVKNGRESGSHRVDVDACGSTPINATKRCGTKRDKAFRVRTRPYAALIRVDDERARSFHIGLSFYIFGRASAHELREKRCWFFIAVWGVARPSGNYGIFPLTRATRFESENSRELKFLIRQWEKC